MYMRERFYADLPPMANAISMDVTEGAQWFLRDDERTTFYSWNEFHCLVPPAEDLWLEFLFPRQLRTDAGVVDMPSHLHSAAMRLETAELEPHMRESVRGRHYRFLKRAMVDSFPKFGLQHIRVEDTEDSDTPPRWLVVGRTAVASKYRVAVINLWSMTLDDSGKFIRSLAAPLPWGLYVLGLNCSEERAQAAYAALPPEQQAEMRQELKDEFEQPFFYCLALLNCRNIQVKDRPAPPAPILKQRAKKGAPYFQYKVLAIPALRAARAASQVNPGEAEPKALHFVRAHFKDFTEKGLFGKNKGVYWWHSQVRGDTAKGVVDKDYRQTHE
jgi:hypothetical protein